MLTPPSAAALYRPQSPPGGRNGASLVSEHPDGVGSVGVLDRVLSIVSRSKAISWSLREQVLVCHGLCQINAISSRCGRANFVQKRGREFQRVT